MHSRWSTSVDNARQERDAGALVRIGGELERDGHFRDAWNLLAEGGERMHPSPLPTWGGPGDSTNCLLIRRRIRHLGAELRQARFIDHAVRDVPRVLVATEDRLIPLLRRSFPRAQFVSAGDHETIAEADSEASYERLASYYGQSHEAIVRSFRPLAAPSQPAKRHGLGIAWHSSNGRKQLPTIKDWASILGSVDFPVQSLQYDEEQAGLQQLVLLAGRSIIRSPIDQRQDIDGFAGQVASVGGVLTISNTTAHMAGALGIPCVVVLDDLDHLTWPAHADHSPFYPMLRTVRQSGREWQSVMQEALALLQSMAREERKPMLISDAYRELNKDLHELGSYGRKGDKWVERVRGLIDNVRPATILDYGCGQGALGRALSCPISEYDPAIPGKDAPPQPADLVVCTDVLEHIEPECLEAVLDELKRLTRSCLFAVVSTRPAKKFLSDGRNAHLIVEPWEFWEKKLSDRFRLVDVKIHQKEVEVVLIPA